MIEGVLQATEWGTPQGSPLSPLLANSLLDDLDQELEQRGHRFARYVDEVVIMVKSSRAGRRVMASVTRYLTRVLRLKRMFSGGSFPRKRCWSMGLNLACVGLNDWNSWDSPSKEFGLFGLSMRGLTSRRWRVSMEYRIKRLNLYVRGWMNYFGISQLYGPMEWLDGWLRRRIRMCYWKQWRRPRTRISNLLKLGTSSRHAFSTGLSRKGYWRLSRTLATHTGMTNEWLAQQGLLSIRDLWMKVQGYV
jgi:RNA-directed DNA polymerase